MDLTREPQEPEDEGRVRTPSPVSRARVQRTDPGTERESQLLRSSEVEWKRVCKRSNITVTTFRMDRSNVKKGDRSVVSVLSDPHKTSKETLETKVNSLVANRRYETGFPKRE